MKSLVLATLLSLVATSATATSILIPQRDTRVIEYSVLTQNAKMSSKHIKQLGAGSVEVNHFTQTVSLSLYEMSVCPAGLACTQEVQGVFANLPIVERKTGACNILTITAKRDDRPADGILELITIEDYSNTTCRFYVPYTASATYVTSFYNRMTGKKQTHRSSFSVQMTNIRSAIDTETKFELTGGEYIKGFYGLAMMNGSLKISADSVKMLVKNIAFCPPEAKACKAGPAPSFELNLPIISREKNACGDYITAQQMLPSGDVETLSIIDYSNSVCDMVVRNIINARYELVNPYSFQPVQEAVFYFDPANVVY